MCAKAMGWLFGLTSQDSAQLSCEGLLIRQMNQEEARRILASSQDFFAKDAAIWQNTIASFPLVYEKDVRDDYSIGGEESVGFLFNLLSPGEVRVPIQWMIRGKSGATASSSTVIDYFFRRINGRFQEISFASVRGAASAALRRLNSQLMLPNALGLDPILMERVYAIKRFPLKSESPKANAVSRAAEICMGLEYLMHEGATAEVLFRLSLTLAWLLESEPAKREETLMHVKSTYELRSKTVHGVRLDSKTLNKVSFRPVLATDLLFRRAVLARLMLNAGEDRWLEVIRQSRLGFEIELDRADWMTE